jgi:hypothetical protein
MKIYMGLENPPMDTDEEPAREVMVEMQHPPMPAQQPQSANHTAVSQTLDKENDAAYATENQDDEIRPVPDHPANFEKNEAAVCVSVSPDDPAIEIVEPHHESQSDSEDENESQPKPDPPAEESEAVISEAADEVEDISNEPQAISAISPE